MKPSKKKPAKRTTAKRAVRRGSIEHKLMQLHNRINDWKTGRAAAWEEKEAAFYKAKDDKEWVWTLVERVQNNEHLTKAVLLKANNLWRTYA